LEMPPQSSSGNDDDTMLRPPLNRGMRALDRSLFRKTVPLSAASIFRNSDISPSRKLLERSKDLFVCPRINTVHREPVEGSARRCLLLRPEIKHDNAATWSQQLRELVDRGTASLIPYELKLDYSFWTYDEVMDSVIGKDDPEAYPQTVNQAGHVCHLNLRPQHFPYKHLIATVLLDKTPSARTVINKTDLVGDASTYRTFSYEVLAGDDDLNVTLHEHDCAFAFDYAKVYWNSRLGTEHRRLVADFFAAGDAVCDAMAGVGPFAVPAAKHRRCFVWANDLNPDAAEALRDNVARNKVADLVTVFNDDAYGFIRSATRRLLDADTPQSIQHQQASRAKSPPPASRTPRTYTMPRVFAHYVMNLPASALDFLPAFVGLYRPPDRPLFASPTSPSGLRLPMVHVYCFRPKDDDAQRLAEGACAEVSERIGAPVRPGGEDVHVHDVRDVAPGKTMVCVSFRLPEEVAFKEV
ncbi:guanine methyltransferase Trm5, partial [Lineolata rhizophorae]